MPLSLGVSTYLMCGPRLNPPHLHKSRQTPLFLTQMPNWLSLRRSVLYVFLTFGLAGDVSDILFATAPDVFTLSAKGWICNTRG